MNLIDKKIEIRFEIDDNVKGDYQGLEIDLDMKGEVGIIYDGIDGEYWSDEINIWINDLKLNGEEIELEEDEIMDIESILTDSVEDFINELRGVGAVIDGYDIDEVFEIDGDKVAEIIYDFVKERENV